MFHLKCYQQVSTLMFHLKCYKQVSTLMFHLKCYQQVSTLMFHLKCYQQVSTLMFHLKCYQQVSTLMFHLKCYQQVSTLSYLSRCYYVILNLSFCISNSQIAFLRGPLGKFTVYNIVMQLMNSSHMMTLRKRPKWAAQYESTDLKSTFINGLQIYLYFHMVM